jgi:hypothetical protein
MILVIYTWGILCFVIIGYVVFRFFTDKKGIKKQHFLYPLVSNPTDGMFPEKGNYVGWGIYLFVLFGLIVFLFNMFYEFSK